MDDVTTYCDICSDQTASWAVTCKACNELHLLCTMCLENGHMDGGVSWELDDTLTP